MEIQRIWFIIAAQRPQNLILRISATPITSHELLGEEVSRKRCTIDYECGENHIRDQFGWRKYMEKWITAQQIEAQQ